MTQQDQTLALLRARGSTGLHTFEMRKAFIGNPSERIARLEARGHRIRVSEKERLNGQAWGVRYFLEHDAERDVPVVQAGAAGTVPLLDAPPSDVSLSAGLFDADEFEQRPRGAYDEDVAA